MALFDLLLCIVWLAAGRPPCVSGRPAVFFLRVSYAARAAPVSIRSDRLGRRCFSLSGARFDRRFPGFTGAPTAGDARAPAIASVSTELQERRGARAAMRAFSGVSERSPMLPCRSEERRTERVSHERVRQVSLKPTVSKT